MYTYKRTEPGLWTVGSYSPDGGWEPESDHGGSGDAAQRCHWLNGGEDTAVEGRVAELERAVRELRIDINNMWGRVREMPGAI